MATKAEKIRTLLNLMDDTEQKMVLLAIQQKLMGMGIRNILKDVAKDACDCADCIARRENEPNAKVDPHDPVPSDIEILRGLGIKEDSK